MKVTTVVRSAAAARIGVGVSLALGTRRFLKAMLRGEEASPTFTLFVRTVGIRDTAFGLGCLLSSIAGRPSAEMRRWIQLWLASEMADVALAVVSARQFDAAGAAGAAAAPLPFIAADVWALRRLRESDA